MTFRLVFKYFPSTFCEKMDANIMLQFNVVDIYQLLFKRQQTYFFIKFTFTQYGITEIDPSNNSTFSVSTQI